MKIKPGLGIEFINQFPKQNSKLDERIFSFELWNWSESGQWLDHLQTNFDGSSEIETDAKMSFYRFPFNNWKF